MNPRGQRSKIKVDLNPVSMVTTDLHMLHMKTVKHIEAILFTCQYTS